MHARHPEKANQILHFPLEVEDRYILPDARRVPEPNTVGYIGNLTDRVDWSFVAEVVAQSPHASFIFVGDLTAGSDGRDPRWRDIRSGVLSQSNVRYVGPVEQDKVMELYWSFAINWMPSTLCIHSMWHHVQRKSWTGLRAVVPLSLPPFLR